VILVEPFKTAPMNSAIRLYEHELSGNAYKVRLFLLLLGLPFAAQRVDLFAGEGQKP
jgi:glutathione S-transferase